MKTNTLMPVIKAILNDEEFLCGGIFTKEKTICEKIWFDNGRNRKYSDLFILCITYQRWML